MDGVWYSAVGAVFVLGLVFLGLYGRRSTAHPPEHASVDPSDETESSQLRQTARSEAAALRQAAQVEADGLRRAAETDAEATRQAARADQQVARARAEELLATAREEADAVLIEARRAGAAEVDALTADLARQQSAQATRATRLEETERLLDAREDRVTARAGELHGLEDALAGTKRDLDAQHRRLESERADLDRAAQEHTRELERIAGLTTDEAKAELLAGVEARRAPRGGGAGPHDRERGPRRGHRPGPQRSWSRRSSGSPASRPPRPSSACCTCPATR